MKKLLTLSCFLLVSWSSKIKAATKTEEKQIEGSIIKRTKQALSHHKVSACILLVNVISVFCVSYVNKNKSVEQRLKLITRIVEIALILLVTSLVREDMLANIAIMRDTLNETKELIKSTDNSIKHVDKVIEKVNSVLVRTKKTIKKIENRTNEVLDRVENILSYRIF